MPDKDVLSHEEIDALLSNVEQDEGADPDNPTSVVKSFDLTEKSTPRHGRLPILEMIGERFARATRKSLQNLFRQTVDVGAAGLQSHSFEDYSKTLKIPASISVMELRPIGGHCLFVLSADLVDRFVDRYFGGLGEAVEQVSNGREFTPTEKRVISRVRDLLCQDLCMAWQDILPLKHQLVTEESNPHLVNVYAQDDELLVVSYPVVFADVTGDLSLVLPRTGLAPYLGRLGAQGRTDEEPEDPQWQSTLEAALLDTEVEANCCVATQKVRLIDLMDLKPGDILDVDMPAWHELLVDNVSVLRGRLQEADGKLVIECGSEQ